MAALAAGELLTEDFLRCEASRMTGELVLDGLDLAAAELPLTVRSRAGAATGAVGLASDSSGNSENQLSVDMRLSPWNMGEVS